MLDSPNLSTAVKEKSDLKKKFLFLFLVNIKCFALAGCLIYCHVQIHIVIDDINRRRIFNTLLGLLTAIKGIQGFHSHLTMN